MCCFAFTAPSKCAPPQLHLPSEGNTFCSNVDSGRGPGGDLQPDRVRYRRGRSMGVFSRGDRVAGLRGDDRVCRLGRLDCAAGAVAVILFILYQAYRGSGAYNFGAVSFRDVGGSAYGSYKVVVDHMQRNFATDWQRVGFLGAGGFVTAGMIALRYLSPRFSIHPIGFAIGAALILRSSASSIFIVWMLKSVILKMGSLSLYRQAAPLFLGIMVGHMAGIGLGVVVDAVWFPGNGHPLNRW